MSFLTPTVSGEREVLRTFALQQLAQLRTSVHGATPEQLHARPTVSAFTLARLLRHSGQVALGWSLMIAAAPGSPAEFDGPAPSDETTGHETPEELLAEFDDLVRQSAEALGRMPDPATLVPVPAEPWFPADHPGWEVRWAAAHLIEELARHAGHADLLRESLDGKGAYELNARADGELGEDEDYAEYARRQWGAEGTH